VYRLQQQLLYAKLYDENGMMIMKKTGDVYRIGRRRRRRGIIISIGRKIRKNRRKEKIPP
jgi:hypothetical protein